MDTKKLIEELKRREKIWRESSEDPYTIANAVIAALVEVRDSIETACKDEKNKT